MTRALCGRQDSNLQHSDYPNICCQRRRVAPHLFLSDALPVELLPQIAPLEQFCDICFICAYTTHTNAVIISVL